ncbi:unnamed protein product [Linum tenue]|uniref:RING-type E3 ubiquitin transferase n=1 Tax=Linum tenue TaxID=586396 RepID=A0AAV0NAL6_9ROSI|nr:unnamed protein product [Linum tenue]
MIDDEQRAKQKLTVHKQRWSIFSSRRSLSWAASPSSNSNSIRPQTSLAGVVLPTEFLCPISGSLMTDPVIVSSGHTFDRACLQACHSLGFSPVLTGGGDDNTSFAPDFSYVAIPNLALKSAILNWCNTHSISHPKPLDYSTAESIVRAKMEDLKKQGSPNLKENRGVIETGETQFAEQGNPDLVENRAIETGEATQKTRVSTSSEESITSSPGSSNSSLPLRIPTRPVCYSSRSASSSSEPDETVLDPVEEALLAKLKSAQVFEIEDALISLRNMTRTKEENSVNLCTPAVLSALRTLISSRYTNVQVNAVASLVNLSLQKQNKVKIVRSGLLPPLIDVLKGGFPEAQDHAAGAIFSLALDDHNKTAIGVLGALPPLLNLLRSGSERTRDDSALALYHLSLIQSNRSKMVRIGSVGVLLGILKSGHMAGRVLLILGNLAFCVDGRAAMLDGGGVECLVNRLRGESEPELESDESIEESCVTVLCGLCQGGLRFKGLAKAAGAEEVLATAAERGRREGTREKARMVLEMLRRKAEEDTPVEEVDWGELLEMETRWEFPSKTR